MSDGVDPEKLNVSMRKPSARLTSLALLSTAMALLAIIALMLTPVRHLPVRGPSELEYFAHAMMYFCLVLPSIIVWPKYTVHSAIVACLAGILIELVQPYFHRGFEISDLVANTVGIFMAIVARKLLHRLVAE